MAGGSNNVFGGKGRDRQRGREQTNREEFQRVCAFVYCAVGVALCFFVLFLSMKRIAPRSSRVILCRRYLEGERLVTERQPAYVCTYLHSATEQFI